MMAERTRREGRTLGSDVQLGEALPTPLHGSVWEQPLDDHAKRGLQLVETVGKRKVRVRHDPRQTVKDRTEAIEALALDAFRRLRHLTRPLERRIEQSCESVRGRAGLRPVTLPDLAEGGDVPRFLSASRVQHLDLMRRIEQWSREIVEVEPTKIGKVLRDAADRADAIALYALETLPEHRKPKGLDLLDLRRRFRAARDPEAYERLQLHEAALRVLDENSAALRKAIEKTCGTADGGGEGLTWGQHARTRDPSAAAAPAPSSPHS